MNSMDTTEQNGFIAQGRHPVNIAHLVMGLVFLGIVAIWALIEGDVVTSGDVRWLLPLPWVIAGGAGLVATVLSARRRLETER